MSKIRTLTMLQRELDDDFGWRLKELADVNLYVKSSSGASSRTALRAGVALLYAHWEGFVKSASLAYLNFVNCQSRTYRELDSCFTVFGVKKAIHEVAESNKAQVNIAAVEFLLAELDKKASLNLSGAVNTESNLKSSIFESIALSIGLDTTWYKPKYNLIDVSLLKRRNSIAHGEYLDIGPPDYSSLSKEVTAMMRAYKTDIENAASLGTYLRPSA